MNKQEHDEIKKLEEENELLRIKVAYLECSYARFTDRFFSAL